ncbi:effector-associated constant component EACC1 [Streptosporangium amethystogenes]|uniref:effector-associated constant component EACC1 n=1 Tax=Streptosporangium amethystogenes TaxID=2002 RepID=UPI00068FF9C7|nr:hypothetical protein [Streptosporangium amethystogenes]
MDVLVRAEADQLRDLHSWLIEEPEFRGHVRILERDRAPHELGPTTDLLQVALGSGGAVAALAGIVVAWLNSRPGEVSIRISRGDQEVEVTAKGVKSLTPEGVRALTGQISEAVADRPSDGA